MEQSLDQNATNNQAQVDFMVRSKMNTAGGWAKAMGIVFLGLAFVAFIFVLLSVYASTQTRWGSDEFLIMAFFLFLGMAVFFLIGFFTLRFGIRIRRKAADSNTNLMSAFSSLSGAMAAQTIFFGLGLLVSLVLVLLFLEEVSRMGRYY